jgi:tetratricopeptide (TPR) repeat protein
MVDQLNIFAPPTSVAWSAAAAMEMAARAYRGGDYDGAARQCRELIARNAWHFEALHLLGVVSLERSHFDDAITCLDRATKARPDNALVFFQLANALLGLERYEAAVVAFRKTVALAPGHFDALNIMGNALAALERNEDAIACYRQALAIRPGYPPALFNLGKRQRKLGRLEEAADSFRHALANAGAKADPARLSDIHCELGGTLMELGRPEEALAETRAMSTVDAADRHKADWQAAMVLLALGRYAEGWQKYESRYSIEDHTPPHPEVSVIDPAEVAGKHILVCSEQGFGDNIFFARYVRQLTRAGAIVSLAVYPELIALLNAMDDIASVTKLGEDEPSFDRVTSFPSLPLAFRTELQTIPAEVPYLRAPENQLAAWQERLGPAHKPRIGICWWGSQHIPQRSMPIATLAPALSRSDVEFHSLLKDPSASDRAWLDAHPEVHNHSAALTDFADTAALISLMDLVISIDTSVAHLAGALARPVWIMLPSSADWRWLLDRKDSPWYPTAHLFRQPRFGDWTPVVAAVGEALDQYEFKGFECAPDGTHRVEKPISS